MGCSLGIPSVVGANTIMQYAKQGDIIALNGAIMKLF
ncbi:hypothetical protein ONA24_06100 [Mycoplasmopsis cynos]|nr:hypothetical protein [Mycoplasmopsis cynos]WAM09537.1 hypothetical protein ONA24_06100 [Mycoplasmopsis cynos]